MRDSFDINRTAGIYAFTVYGPNGFVREFGSLTPPGSGSVTNPPADPELATQYDVANGNVSLQFTNRGRGIAHLSVADNAYGAQPRSVVVPSLGTMAASWVLSASHHWYDLATSPATADPTFLRRLVTLKTADPVSQRPAAVAPVTVLPPGQRISRREPTSVEMSGRGGIRSGDYRFGSRWWGASPPRWIGYLFRHAYKFGGWLLADSAGCSLGRFSHWWRSVWVSVFGEGGFHTSVALASTVLLGCQKRGNRTLGQLMSPRSESVFFASFLCRFGQRNDVPPRTVANSDKEIS